ncbi:MAG: hypothetical protein ACHQ50_10720 [Fimbriimonadales bacterium]
MPNPAPSVIKAIRVGNPISVLDNIGDTWVGAWGEDGELYAPSNDTFGFNAAGNSNIAINLIIGDDLLSLAGETVNTMADYGVSSQEGPDGCNWKSGGCCSIDGVLYWVVSRHKYGETSGDSFRRQTARNASIIKSADRGKTWTRPAKDNYDHPMFPGSRFAAPFFIDYGKNQGARVDQADRYVYALSNNGFWDNGDNIILGRVPKADLGKLNSSDWEYYTGGDGMLAANWTGDSSRAALILDQPGHLGMAGATYLPAFHCYLMIGWYYPKGGGKMPGASRETVWDFYQSPKPWGPWTRFASHHFAPQGYYCPSVCLKFSANHGKRLFAITAGDWNDHSVYRLTFVPLDLD